MDKAKVYYTKNITSDSLIKIYDALGVKLEGNVAVKVSTGEKGSKGYLKADLIGPLVKKIGGTIVECNTAYAGERDTTEKHLELFKYHGWSEMYDVDLLDAEGPDLVLEVKNHKQIDKNYVGKNLANYDSLLVLSHFKGHPMGGYGGALKQLSIGIGSSFGKA